MASEYIFLLYHNNALAHIAQANRGVGTCRPSTNDANITYYYISTMVRGGSTRRQRRLKKPDKKDLDEDISHDSINAEWRDPTKIKTTVVLGRRECQKLTICTKLNYSGFPLLSSSTTIPVTRGF
jgi:hypothetical protein